MARFTFVISSVVRSRVREPTVSCFGRRQVTRSVRMGAIEVEHGVPSPDEPASFQNRPVPSVRPLRVLRQTTASAPSDHCECSVRPLRPRKRALRVLRGALRNLAECGRALRKGRKNTASGVAPRSVSGSSSRRRSALESGSGAQTPSRPRAHCRTSIRCCRR